MGSDAATQKPWDMQLVALRPQLVTFARMRLRDRNAAEDLVQDALVAALEHARQFEGRSSTRTWVTAILKNKIVDHVGRSAREFPLDVHALDEACRELDDASAGSPGEPAPRQSWQNDPQESLAQRQFLSMLDGCVTGLPPQMAQAFVMRECLGMTTDEICRELDITQANCWVILCRARMKLRERLQGHGFVAPACERSSADRESSSTAAR